MTDSKEDGLLPCPYCGSDARVVGNGPFHAVCNSCAARTATSFSDTPAGAVALWNLRASSPPVGGSGEVVVVKPLEWGEPYRHGEYVSVDARSVVGSYSIFQLRPDLMATWCYYGREQGVVDTLDAAKAAAQADYETRIRSALAAPVPNGGPEGLEVHGLDTPTHVFFYEQDFYVLSNFSAFSLYSKGRRFDTSEAAYHYEKFAGLSAEADRIADYITVARSAHDAFKIAEANKHLRRPDWDAVKVGIMRDILRGKADQHEYVRRKLLATGDRVLVENSWRDDFWGWGPNRDGQNMLGKLWMEVRDELRPAASPVTPEGLSGGDPTSGGEPGETNQP